MDGNSSWALSKGVFQFDGYLCGMKNISKIVFECIKNEVKYATFFAFSTENWNRTEHWISSFMLLSKNFFKNDPSIDQMKNAGVRLNLIGDITRLDNDLQEILLKAVADTKDNNKIDVYLALNYGGHDEIVRASRKIAAKKLEITEKTIKEHLDTAGIPDPDMIIRTGGEQRLSNFLLWQSSYSELYFTRVFWPDFDEFELQKAIDDFYMRERKYGA
jgi:undecaprenyl diphosphate synthase